MVEPIAQRHLSSLATLVRLFRTSKTRNRRRVCKCFQVQENRFRTEGILITSRKLFPAAQSRRRRAVRNANKPGDRFASAVDHRFEPEGIQLKYFFAYRAPENDQRKLITSIQRPYCQKRNLRGERSEH